MEPVYKYYKPAWKSFYKLWILMLLILVLAVIGSYYGPFKCQPDSSLCKWMWIIVAVIEVFIFLYIAVKRKTMQLILRNNPNKAEDQEVAFVVIHPLKPFSPDFRESIEISLANITHIKVGQTMMQSLLGIGDLIITSSGTSGEEILAKNIPHPQEVRDEIQIHARSYTMPTPPHSPNFPQSEQ